MENTENISAVLAQNISSLRVSCGMTQLELAEALNYSDKLVSKWERGDAAPNAETLLKLSKLFGVSVEYLFHPHSAEELSQLKAGRDGAQAGIKKAKARNRGLITAISILGIWMVALLIFIILWILSRPIWSIFVYALPVCFVTLLVFNSVWNRGRYNSLVISALIVSIVLSFYVIFLKYNCWQLFLLLIPAEALVFLSSRIKLPTLRGGKRKSAENGGKSAGREEKESR